jgi:hypothetical protein
MTSCSPDHSRDFAPLILRQGRARGFCAQTSWLAGALALGFLCVACDRKQHHAKDFSKSSAVSILLGEEGKESGEGLQIASGQEDGLTSATVLDGVPCRFLHRDGGSSAYLYLIIDPTFKKGRTMDVTVEIEYFDEGRGGLGLQFDTNRTKNATAAAYKRLKGGDPMKFQEDLRKVLQAAYVDLKERVRFQNS